MFIYEKDKSELSTGKICRSTLESDRGLSLERDRERCDVERIVEVGEILIYIYIYIYPISISYISL